MQEVHEEHGRVRYMAVGSRRLLVIAAFCIVFAALGINIADGGSAFLVVAAGSFMILAGFAWFMFEATSSTKETGSTAIKAAYSLGEEKSLNSQETQQKELPDPLDSGFDIPLM